MRRHRVFKILFIIGVLLPPAIAILYMVVLPVIAVNGAISSEEASIRELSTGTVSAGGSEKLATYIAAGTDEAFWKNRLAMSKSGAVGLVVDLPGRKVSLDIRGVPIRECAIQEMKISEALLKRKRQSGIINWVASPHVLEKEWTTIVKQPIKVKIAPKNEAEAEAQMPEKIEQERNDVQYSLRFKPELTIHFEQIISEMNSVDWKEKLMNDLRLKWKIAVDSLQQITRGELPEHGLSISIKIAPDDARAIYRALPENARLALRL